MNTVETHFVNHCLRGLERMYMPSAGVFSASHRMLEGTMVNIYDRDTSYKYTMNTLMGLFKARVARSEAFLDIDSVYRGLAGRVQSASRSQRKRYRSSMGSSTAWTNILILARRVLPGRWPLASLVVQSTEIGHSLC
jgi:hypothetical protein